MKTVLGYRLNRFGMLHPVDVLRPVAGGGLEVLGRHLRCEAKEVECLQLNNWVQVWVNGSKRGNPAIANDVLTATVALLGVDAVLGGDGLFLATLPDKWEVIGLNATQVSAVSDAREKAVQAYLAR